jgi:hypothetical protein
MISIIFVVFTVVLLVCILIAILEWKSDSPKSGGGLD